MCPSNAQIIYGCLLQNGPSVVSLQMIRSLFIKMFWSVSDVPLFIGMFVLMQNNFYLNKDICTVNKKGAPNRCCLLIAFFSKP